MAMVSAAIVGLAVVVLMRRNMMTTRPHTRENDDEDEDGMPLLPKNVEKYSQLPKTKTATITTTTTNGKSNNKVFTATTIPKGLLNRHNTKVGTWGVLTIFRGSLEYKIAPRENTMRKEVDGEDDNVAYPTQFVLDASSSSSSSSSRNTGIIEPQRYHKVVPMSDDVEFIIEFYRVPGTGPVEEKRE